MNPGFLLFQAGPLIAFILFLVLYVLYFCWACLPCCWCKCCRPEASIGYDLYRRDFVVVAGLGASESPLSELFPSLFSPLRS